MSAMRTTEAGVSVTVPRRLRHTRALLIGVLLVAAFCCMSVAGARAAAPGPVWSLTGISYPTNFAPGESTEEFVHAGPGFEIVATNIGGGATDGTFTIEDTLPPGLTPAAGAAPHGNYGHAPFSELSCGVAGQTVSCVGGEAGTPAIRPGEQVVLYVPVDSSAGLVEGDELANLATVSGGAAAAPASGTVQVRIESSPPAFGFLDGDPGFSYGKLTEPDGTPSTRAGSHPSALRVGLGFPNLSDAYLLRAIDGGVKDVSVDLPKGTVVDPLATATRCTEAQLETVTSAGSACPDSSQIGTVSVTTAFLEPTTEVQPLWSMVPQRGHAGEFGFNALYLGIYVHIFGRVLSNGEYRLSADSHDLLSRSANPILGVEVTIWGDPSSDTHSGQRGVCANRGIEGLNECPVESTGVAAVTLPSACSGPTVATAKADSWVQPGRVVERTATTTGSHGEAIGVDGCGELEFSPSIASVPTSTAADSPSGLDFDLHQPQNQRVDRLATATLKDARVTLPPGLVVNPSAANGLAACSEAEIGYEPQEGKIRFSEEPQSCPDGSKLGTLEVTTPLLDHALPGAIYLAAPHGNPFNNLLAVYLAIEDEQSGTIAKLAGRIDPDPRTGQLTATFEENPELPLEDVRLHFFPGERGSLRIPSTCGTYTTDSTLTPWSTPQGSDAHPSATFSVSRGAAGGACPGSASAEPNSPSFEAGTRSPLAGSFSPFVLKLSRQDGSQEFGTLNVSLPPGLTGKLAGVPYCPEPAIAAAGSKSGEEERRSLSCPSGSEVGTVTVGAGSGSQPYYVQGHAYLAGPYKGAPISLAIITPAVAGPFDLGTVVVRAGLYVNPETAQIMVKSDPIPSILQGIPLDIRSIAVSIDRGQFTLNPTSCEVMAVDGESVSTQGQAAKLTNRFQVGGCSGLPFKPTLKLQVMGKTNRNAKPRLKAVLTTKPGEANIRRAQVNLPHSLFLEQNHIKTVCTRVQFAEGNGNGSACPRGSIYGKARAWTPLLDHPLEGYVYLRSNGGERKLPDLVAALNGQVDIALRGKVDSGKNHGLRNTFELVPDAPVSRFVLEMSGNKNGLLVNSENLCSRTGKKRRAIVRLTGQNGKVAMFKPKVAAGCGREKKSSKSGN